MHVFHDLVGLHLPELLDGAVRPADFDFGIWLFTEPEVQPAIAEGSFHAYAAQRDIGCCRVELNPGDLYFFNTRCIHEVPALQGNSARIVLAVFIGYSPEDGEIFVWS